MQIFCEFFSIFLIFIVVENCCIFFVFFPNFWAIFSFSVFKKIWNSQDPESGICKSLKYLKVRNPEPGSEVWQLQSAEWGSEILGCAPNFGTNNPIDLRPTLASAGLLPKTPPADSWPLVDSLFSTASSGSVSLQPARRTWECTTVDWCAARSLLSSALSEFSD